MNEKIQLLEDSEQKYYDLYENAPDMLCSVDPKTATLKSCNTTLVNALGYSNKSEVIGTPIFSIYHEDCHDEVKKAFAIFQKEGEVQHKHLTLRKKDGSKIDVSLKVTSVKDSNGNILYSRSSWRDITEMISTEQELAEKDVTLQTFLELTGDGWWDWDLGPEGKGTDNEYLSPRFKEILGFEDHEMENKASAWMGMINPDDLEKAKENLEKHISSDTQHPYYQEVRYTHRQGHTVWVICKGVALKNSKGKYTRMVGTHTDITALKNAEFELTQANSTLEQKVEERTRELFYANEKLKEKNSEFEGIFQAFPDLLFRLEEDGTIYSYEADKSDLLYVDPETFVGKKMQEVLPQHIGPMFASTLGKVKETRSRQQISYELEIEGNTHFFEARLLPFSSNKVLTVVRDITEKVRAEKELEISRTQSLLQAKMASLGLMAGGIAHEVNNPLSIINGYVNVLRMKAKKFGVSNDEIFKTADKIDTTVNRIAHIINGLKRISRDDSNAELESVPIGQILDDTIPLCRERFKNHGIDLVVSCTCENANVFCRPTEISQVILNLLNNAFDAVVESEEKNVLVKIDNLENGHVEFRVEDSGPGVAKENQRKIFDPFFTTKPTGQGTGLGLSICQGIIDSHRGYLKFHPGEKTRFVFALPQANATLTEIKQAA